MKVLHTADWHIGKHLYKRELNAELSLFFDFLLDTVISENVDVLLVSGDIFDTATPSNQDRALYYNVLSRLVKVGARVIITAGNHDSISQIEASGELLKMLNIDVVGGISDTACDMIMELKKDDKIGALLMAVPYIRDSDFRKYNQDSIFNKNQEMRGKVVGYYQELSDYVKKNYNHQIPLIAMGHLFVMGATTADSERDIEVGTLGGIAAVDLENIADYIALGHLHRPQSFCNGKIRYSGSPVALSFSERNDIKCMFLLEVTENNIQCNSIEIPVFRKLYRITGSFEEVRQKLNELPKVYTLKHYVEIIISEETENPELIYQLQELVMPQDQCSYEVLQYRLNFKSLSEKDIQQDIHLSLDEMSPTDLFEELLSYKNTEDSTNNTLRQSFAEMLNLYYEHTQQDTII